MWVHLSIYVKKGYLHQYSTISMHQRLQVFQIYKSNLLCLWSIIAYLFLQPWRYMQIMKGLNPNKWEKKTLKIICTYRYDFIIVHASLSIQSWIANHSHKPMTMLIDGNDHKVFFKNVDFFGPSSDTFVSFFSQA